VYIVVVGLVVDVLRSLGAEIDEHFEEHQAEPHTGQEDGEVPAETTARGKV
jgi:multicomponent Na+:H+ antiporter subunit A